MALSSMDFTIFREYTAIRKRLLAAIGCSISCRDPLAEFSEWLVCKHLEATTAASRVQKGYDLSRSDGRRVQVKSLANPSERWVNEHDINFTGGTDDYALVVFEAFEIITIVIFRRETISEVCHALGKRHPNQNLMLKLTQRDLQRIMSDPSLFMKLGVEVVRPEEVASEILETP